MRSLLVLHSETERQPQVFSEFCRVCLWFLDAIHRLISFLSFYFYRFQSRFISYKYFLWIVLYTYHFWIGTSSTDNGKKDNYYLNQLMYLLFQLFFPFSFRIQPIKKTGMPKKWEKFLKQKRERRNENELLADCKTCAVYVEFFFLLFFGIPTKTKSTRQIIKHDEQEKKLRTRKGNTIRCVYDWVWLLLKKESNLYISHFSQFIPHMHNANYKANGFKLWMKQNKKYVRVCRTKVL